MHNAGLVLPVTLEYPWQVSACFPGLPLEKSCCAVRVTNFGAAV